jgi:hypothetical protein
MLGRLALNCIEVSVGAIEVNWKYNVPAFSGV